MSAILTAIVFVKSVSGTRALGGIAMVRLDDEEYIDFQYKAFNVSEGSLLEPIQENTIMLFVGKYVFESQLYVSVALLVYYFPSFVSLLIRKITSPLSF